MSMFFGSAKIMAKSLFVLTFIKGKTLILPPPWLGRSSSWKNHALPSIPSKIARERERERVFACLERKRRKGNFSPPPPPPTSSSDRVG